MFFVKRILAVLMISMLFLISCGNDQTAEKANQEILNDENALSTELVNNPSSDNGDSIRLEQTGLLVFDDTVHDFGNLKDGEVIQHEFEYVNKGSKEVIITSAKGSCGCTVPEYETNPIAPGEIGRIKVTFDSKGKTGYNEKNVQISTNGVPSKYRLTILAKVD